MSDSPMGGGKVRVLNAIEDYNLVDFYCATNDPYSRQRSKVQGFRAGLVGSEAQDQASVY